MWNISVQIVPSNGLVGVMETVFTKGKYPVKRPRIAAIFRRLRHYQLWFLRGNTRLIKVNVKDENPAVNITEAYVGFMMFNLKKCKDLGENFPTEGIFDILDR